LKLLSKAVSKSDELECKRTGALFLKQINYELVHLRVELRSLHEKGKKRNRNMVSTRRAEEPPRCASCPRVNYGRMLYILGLKILFILQACHTRAFCNQQKKRETKAKSG